MSSRLPKIVCAAVLLCLLGGFWFGWRPADPPRILVFSKTAGFRHASIEAGIAAIQKLGREHGFLVDTTESATNFNEQNLKRYRAVVFLNTTGDVLDQAQQNDFERFIQAGGGYVGIHAATDTEYDWPWYGKLAGAYFDNHPMPDNVQRGTFLVVDKSHPASEGLPDRWEREDEFYSFRDISPAIRVLIKIDEGTYRGGTNGADHPMAWYQEYDGGRAFYTNMGHTEETFSEPLFLQHLLGGLRYAMGDGALDYSRARTQRVPEENRFTKIVLGERLNEPMELAVLPDERVLFIERRGDLKRYDPATGRIDVIASIPVSTKYTAANGEQSEAEDGLLGIAADPNFAENNWIYLYYSPAGDEPKNVLARYVLRGDELDLASGKVMLEVPVQREQCCHTGGSIAFDADGNLYLSTGDNTNPHGTGYAPIDEREGRSAWDAQKSSSNTNDLRGKILRIRPQADGSYTIPDGNLFPPGTPKTRPEIYTMGHRNPFRISVDRRTGFLYWGDVGPDASRDSTNRGPAGHDEFGQARAAGNFGWPYFVGDNKAYWDYDFATGTPGAQFDAARPVNTSPNNTGLTELPPAQKAFIWYPAAPSPEFPLLGSGGRSAMAGPVFYSADFKDAPRPFPDYYDGKLFIYEWMRGWIMAVTMDEEGNFVSMERFMPSHKFSNPIDMEFAPSGDLYVLEYGTGWFQGNDDARLVRIEYNGGNRKPVVQIAADRTAGATPLQVSLTSDGTSDADGDALTYEWTVTTSTGDVVQRTNEPNTSITLDQPGVYTATLTVTDAQGGRSWVQKQIIAGNEPPEVRIELAGGNRSFFLPGQPIDYVVRVTDREDGSLENGAIRPEQVAVSADYLREGYDQVEIAQGHRSADASAAFATGRRLIEGSTCLSCHQLERASIGPSYAMVAEKYAGDTGAVTTLASKIREGGAGVWGDMMMPPHPQLSEAEATQMVEYILSLAGTQSTPTMPTEGRYTPEIPAEAAGQGVVVLRAAYTDRGAGPIPPTTTEEVLVLRAPTVVVAAADAQEGVQRMKVPQMPVEMAIVQKSGAYAGFKQLDLTGITEVVFMVSAPVQYLNSTGGKIEVRLNAPDGPLLGETPFLEPVAEATGGSMLRATLKPSEGVHDVYFVVRNDDAPAERSLLIMLTAQFSSGSSPAPQVNAPSTQPASSGTSGLSTNSKLSDLIANEQARAVLEKHVPGMTTDPRIDQAMGLSLREIAPYAPDVFTEQLLNAIESDLAKL